MHLIRTLVVDRPTEEVFDYLSDFTTTTEWDPGTERTVCVDGDGGVGTRYATTARFLGRRSELRYLVTAYRRPELVQLRGENRTVTAVDTMTFRPAGAGRTEVTYRAEFHFTGPARWLAPLLAPALRRMGDRAEAGLRRTLSPR